MSELLKTLEDRQWKSIINEFVPPETISSLNSFLTNEISAGKTIYPPKESWFKALNRAPFDDVRVVILGQDPYHGPGQAHGLSFSVPESVKPPPSLRNIFKEQVEDLGIHNESGDLSAWAEQGVLLLNAVLTVEASKAASHAKKGWEVVTDTLIHQLSLQRENIVFMLWGAYAEKKSQLIDTNKHCVLTSTHPSPLSAHRGWFGSKHFSTANKYLRAHSQNEIDWRTSSKNSQLSIFG